jgi:hypothetical protein
LHDRFYMDACSIQVGKVGVPRVENKCQVCPSQDDPIEPLSFDQCMGEPTQKIEVLMAAPTPSPATSPNVRGCASDSMTIPYRAK